jgi:hypothetical protein
MIGVDLGMNVGSVIRIYKGKMTKTRVSEGLVFKFTHEKGLSENARLSEIARRFGEQIHYLSKRYGDSRVAIEEPIFSWGRRNPKGFAKLIALQTLVHYLCEDLAVIPVNNKTAKKFSGSGKNKKQAMIEAFKEETGSYPGHASQYGKETLADSYFIAKAGYYGKRS